MNRLIRFGAALLGLSLLVPIGASAQDAPAGYQPAAVAPHKHKGKGLCAKCAAAQKAGMMPPGKIVACAHSKNGVCTACAAALAMPGPIVMVNQGGPAEAPGRAVASSNTAAQDSAVLADGGMGEPTPVGVVRAGYTQGAPMMAAPVAVPSEAPGRAVAEVGAGPAPFQHKATSSNNPKILGHLFGWSGIGQERSDARRRRKVESHAMISYDNEGSVVNELPSSMVYGR